MLKYYLQSGATAPFWSVFSWCSKSVLLLIIAFDAGRLTPRAGLKVSPSVLRNSVWVGIVDWVEVTGVWTVAGAGGRTAFDTLTTVVEIDVVDVAAGTGTARTGVIPVTGRTETLLLMTGAAGRC